MSSFLSPAAQRKQSGYVENLDLLRQQLTDADTPSPEPVQQTARPEPLPTPPSPAPANVRADDGDLAALRQELERLRRVAKRAESQINFKAPLHVADRFRELCDELEIDIKKAGAEALQDWIAKKEAELGETA